MNERTISVISLSNRDFTSFEEKIREAIRWLEIAAAQGADLAVLPETMNIYCGDGVNNPTAKPMEEFAFDDWETPTGILRDAARQLHIAVTIPVLMRRSGRLINEFHLISGTGDTLGSYRKRFPAYGEVLDGMPGEPPTPLIDWEGIKVGGAICFDTWFPQVFDSQAEDGAQLFLVPSLWPGGRFLNDSALRHSAPIALAYPAWSRIIDINGREVTEGGYRHETLRFGFGSPVYTATLNFNRATVHADRAQEKMLEVEQAYGSRIRIRFDQENCLFYLESRTPDLRIEDILSRFELTTLQQYFRSYRAAQAAIKSL